MTTIPNTLKAIAGNLRAQDNRLTQAPIFIVQRRRRIWGVEEGDGCQWYAAAEWVEVDDHRAAELERHFDIYGEEPEGYTRVCYLDTWEFVTACFTEQGCKDYLALNGHNLQEARICAEGSWRNAEWQAIRDFLLSLDGTASEEESDA